MDVRALSTISQRLAKAHHANMEALNLVPEYLKEFTSVFSKQSFDTLLEPKEWDHAVELQTIWLQDLPTIINRTKGVRHFSEGKSRDGTDLPFQVSDLIPSIFH